MMIFIRTLSGKLFTIEVEKSDSIHDVKLIIQDKENYPPGQQLIIYEGNLLEEQKTLQDYDIQKEDTLRVIFKN
jgi:hypothetical protein